MRPRVFISHSNADREAVDAIRGQAVAAGVEVYLAEHDVRPGESLASKIIYEIENSDAVVVLLTDQSAVAAFVQQEVGVSIAAGVPVFPLVQMGLDTRYLAMLEGVEYVEFDPNNHAPALRALTTRLTGLAEEMHRQEIRDQVRAQARADALLFAAVVVAVVIIGSSSGT